MKFNKNAKVLNITHCDLDGETCSIVLSNVFNDIKVISATFSNIDNIILKWRFDAYDYVFMTDIYPKDLSLLDKIPNLILLDHHATDLAHDESKHRFVVDDMCAAKLVKNYIEIVMHENLSHLNNLVYLANDYDMWIHNNFKSKMINELYFYYKSEKFRNRFMSGDTRLTKSEIKFIRNQKDKFIEEYNKLEVFDLDKINACFISSDFNFLNDLCEKLLKEEKYDIVFCQNMFTGSISARTQRTDIDLGKVLDDMGVGGGHKQSAGIKLMDNTIETTKSMIKVLEYEFGKRYPFIKKKK